MLTRIAGMNGTEMAVVGTWFGRQWGLGRASPNALPLCMPVPPGSKGKTFLCIKLRGQGSWASTLRWDTLGLSWKWVFSAGAVLPLARTRWCLLHHKGWQHGPSLALASWKLDTWSHLFSFQEKLKVTLGRLLNVVLRGWHKSLLHLTPSRQFINTG